MGKERTAKRVLCIVGLTAVAVFVGKLWYWRHNPLGFLGRLFPLGKLVVRVSDMDSGKPLRGAYVHRMMWGNYDNEEGLRTESDGSCRFFAQLAPYYYAVKASLRGTRYFADFPQTDWLEIRVLPLVQRRLDLSLDTTAPRVSSIRIVTEGTGGHGSHLHLSINKGIAPVRYSTVATVKEQDRDLIKHRLEGGDALSPAKGEGEGRCSTFSAERAEEA